MFENIGANINVVIEKINLWMETFLAMLPNFVVAIIVLVGFYFLAKIARNVVGRILSRISNNISVTKLIGTIVFLGVCIAGTFVALGILNLDKTVTSLLAGAGIIGLALSFAFQDTATNFISGVIMAFRKTLNVGDLVEVGDTFGIVERINLRSTSIKTPQGPSVMIPNQDLLQSHVKNYNSQSTRRVDVAVGVGYESDLQKVEDVTIAAIKELDLVKKERGVELYYNEFGGSSINFVVRFWVDFNKQSQYLKAQSEAIKKIKVVYDQNDFNIPYPIRTLDFGMAEGQLPQQLFEIQSNKNHQSKKTNGQKVST
ncbi:MAG: mechanosensitive ion channel family protein [Chitinophagales bacterium]